MPKLLEILLKEGIRGRDPKKTEELIKSSKVSSEMYLSARKGRPSAEDADLRSRAGTEPEKLLEELGILTIKQDIIPEKAIEATIKALLDGKKRDDFEKLFTWKDVSIVRHPTAAKLGIRIPMTEISANMVEKHYEIKKEYAYWFFGTLIAANNTYAILNDIKLQDFLKVGCSNNSYIIYLSRRSWNTL